MLHITTHMINNIFNFSLSSHENTQSALCESGAKGGDRDGVFTHHCCAIVS